MKTFNTHAKLCAQRLGLFIILSLCLAPSRVKAEDILWGVNGHPIGNPVFADYNKQFEVMHQNHLTTYRMDVTLTNDGEQQSMDQLQLLIPLAKKWGIKLRPVMMVAYHWGDRTDAGRYKAGDGQAMYRQGFDRVYNFVRLFKDDIQDWELENELNLLVHNIFGQPLYGYGWHAKEFDRPSMKDWSYILKGMSDAVKKVNSDYGTHLQTLIGTTSTNFGFIDYMQAQGVTFDILSYHYYVKADENPYASFSKATPAYNLFQKLATYGKPVRFTEVNAAEITEKGYANREDDAQTLKGYKSLANILTSLKNQKDMNLEEVDVYELLDDPEQKGPEANFGLMYNLNAPKSVLATVRKIVLSP